MAPIVKLIQGKDQLNLNSGRYCIEESDFLPPTTAREVTFGRASVGQNLASKRRDNRSWGFSVNIEAASVSEAERAMRDLQAFLNRAGDNRSEPLYIAYRAWNGHTYEPFFGQFGAFARYEIEDGKAELASEYLNPLQNSNRIVRLSVDLVIKPQALGLPQRAGQASGRLYEDFLGTADGKPRGVWIEQAPSALEFANPVFMSTTAYDTGWTTAGTGTVKTQNLDPVYIQVGTRSLKFSSIQTNNSATMYQSISVTSGNAYWINCLVKRRDKGAISSSQLGFVFTGTGGNSFYIALGDGWYWCGRRFTATSTASINIGYYWNSPVPVYFDACSISNNTAVPRYLLKEAAWGAYTTAVTSGFLRYKFADLFPARNQWTIRIVWKPPPESAGTRTFIQANDGEISLTLNSSTQLFCQVSSGNSVTSSVISITAGTTIIIHVTYNGDAITIYKDSQSVGTGSGKTAATAEPASFYIGSNTTPANHCFGTIMGVATFAEVMSAIEVTADYNEVVQQVTDDQRVDPLPYLWTNDGDDIIDNEQTSTDRNFCFLSGMVGDDVETEVMGYLPTSAFSTTVGFLFGTVTRSPGTFNSNFFDDEHAEQFFAVDGAGTADTLANNNVTLRQSQTTTILSYCTASPQIVFYPSVRGREIYAWTTMKDAGSNLQIRLAVSLGGEKLYTDWRSVSNVSEYLGFLLGPITVPNTPRIVDLQQKIGFSIEAKRTSGTADLNVSHTLYLMGATSFDASGLATSTFLDTAYIKGREVIVGYSAGTITHGLGYAPYLQRPIDIKPNVINGIFVQGGGDSKLWAADITMDFDKIGITPRWDIY